MSVSDRTHDLVKSSADTSAASAAAFADTMPSVFRGDIEGLRAIAVLAVLSYHAHLGPFQGGYIGVDVFFVVSGFLITSLLMRELLHHGRGALPTFWARRVRRLLPAAFLVIGATLVSARWMLDPLALRDLAHDAIATAAFVINIVFARRESDYLAAQHAPSALLHFWSLALEEQFYLVWPLVLYAVTRFRARPRTMALVTVAVLWSASLAACLWLTPRRQPWAFYLLPTRAWELLTGAGIALSAPAILRLPSVVRAVAGWCGIATIGAAMWWFGSDTEFPGSAALVPVIATGCVIASGLTLTAHGPSRLLASRPLIWVGRRSYGIYLWHWPLLALTAAQFGPQPLWPRVALMILAVALAALSFSVLEDPVRRSRWLAVHSVRSLALGSLGVLCVVGLAISFLVWPQSLTAGERATPAHVIVPSTTTPATPATPATHGSPPTATPIPSITSTSPIESDSVTTVTGEIVPSTADAAPAGTAASPTTTSVLGAPSFDVLSAIIAANTPTLDASTTTRDAPSNLRPDLAHASADRPPIYADGCMLQRGTSTPGACVFGDPQGSITVALFGDSHAAQWFPAMQVVTTAHHWRLLVLTKSGCPTADIRIASQSLDAECGRWRMQVAERLSSEHPALLVMSSYRYRAGGSGVGLDPDQAWNAGLRRTIDALRPLVPQVLILGDTPTPNSDVPSCIAGHLHSVESCVNGRNQAIKPARLDIERSVAAASDATFIPTGDWLCGVVLCPVIIGDVLVYRDHNHITTTASELLSPYVDATLSALLEP